jgi:hypothetical protein
MPQVLIGLFTSYRGGDDALEGFQALGLNPESGHLYQENKRDLGVRLDSEAAAPDLHLEEVSASTPIAPAAPPHHPGRAVQIDFCQLRATEMPRAWGKFSEVLMCFENSQKSRVRGAASAALRES